MEFEMEPRALKRPATGSSSSARTLYSITPRRSHLVQGTPTAINILRHGSPTSHVLSFMSHLSINQPATEVLLC